MAYSGSRHHQRLRGSADVRNKSVPPFQPRSRELPMQDCLARARTPRRGRIRRTQLRREASTELWWQGTRRRFRSIGLPLTTWLNYRENLALNASPVISRERIGEGAAIGSP